MSRAIPWSSSRGPIIGVLLGALIVLTSCSALRLGYNQGPRLAYWWLDGYLEFNEEQTPRVQAAIDDWFGRHRATELPVYLRLLEQAQADVLADATAAQACRWADEILARVRSGYEEAIPAMADVARTLTPRQVRLVERRHAKNNERFRSDHLQDSAEERLKGQVERVVEQAEDFYGRLDSAQRGQVAQWVVDSPFDADLWFAERRRRQQEVVQVLQRLRAESLPTDQAHATLRRLLEHAVRSPRDGYRAYQQRLADYNCGFAARLHNLTTAEQRRHAAAKFKGWEDDLRALVGAAATTVP
ncbi:DUF6279 family lipoprotein [Piscinibacter sp.]|uniref:DUF6279 family lipoprotein n=1 Tax=Piscinibacter sp. TaxID=1903157 RepID=UPI002D0B137F|nr:DUF6279 family lipoprotein [Albitalea sp.]HUG25019.1 DUF6279 family lipoprotein [Albitalea sp.]